MTGGWDPANEQTIRIPAVAGPESDTERTQVIEPVPPGRRRARGRRILLVAAVALGFVALLYGTDVLLSRGEVPRGVQVAGVDVGGLDHGVAEQRLRAQVEPRLDQPVTLRAGSSESTLDPRDAGLEVNWPATLERAGAQPLNPWTRVTSWFTAREVGVVSTAEPAEVRGALDRLRPRLERPAVEGGIRFTGAVPAPVHPVPGHALDVPAAIEALRNHWAAGRPVQLPIIEVPVTVTPEGVAAALRQARVAAAAPVTVLGDGAVAVLRPGQLAPGLRFEPDGHGGLVLRVDNAPLVAAAHPQLARTETAPIDAGITFTSGPTISPSVPGRGVDWNATFAPLPQVLATPEVRRVPAVYAPVPPRLSTEQAHQLGITTLIGEFSTGGFASDSGRNIRRIAEQVNGTIVRPGSTFSLNRHTAPRNEANGYVPAGIIDDGRPSRGVGGGVSQFATTLYNAAYFAGMVDVEHQEHSYYISRYPPGREATVFEGAIDLKFRNDARTGVLIQTEWTPSKITVRLYGTKRFEVESITGARTNPTSPTERTVPPGEPCSSSGGSPGFTITDTRVLRDVATGAERRENRTVTYDPQPKIKCG